MGEKEEAEVGDTGSAEKVCQASVVGWAGERKRELGFRKWRGYLARKQGASGKIPAIRQFCLGKPSTDID